MLDSAKWRVNDLKRYLFKKVFKLLGLMASLGLHLPSEDTLCAYHNFNGIIRYKV